MTSTLPEEKVNNGHPRRSEGKMSSSCPEVLGGSGSGLSLSSHVPNPRRNQSAKPELIKRNKSAGEVDDLVMGGGSGHGDCRTLKACKLCCKKQLRISSKNVPAHLVNPGAADMGDNGLLELIHSIRNQKLYDNDVPSVELKEADDIVARAKVKKQEFEEQRQANIGKYAPQDLNLYQENLDAMGKFEWDELKIGALLGVGGFSNVSEIVGFEMKDGSEGNKNNNDLDGSLHEDNIYTKKEIVARKFLSKHAIRTSTTPAEEKSLSKSKDSGFYSSLSMRSMRDIIKSESVRSTSTASSAGTEQVSYRYAVKHLRPKLSQIYDTRTFHCAAVDLIGEAGFLLSLQHPNIIKLRGFASAGPQGYRQGNHNGYFLILDQLPETMEQRLVHWRKKVKKYKSIKRSLVSKVLMKKNRETASRKLDQLLQERYHVAAEICGAMEYLHDRRMMNRDLKIANIGFDIRGDVKLFDFGLSRWLPTSLLRGDKATPKALLEESFHMSSVGTKLYMAPEVMLKEPYSAKADVYSFGIVLWEMLCLQDPAWKKEAKDAKEVRQFAQEACDNLPLCPCWAPPIHQVIKNCVSNVPSDRPTFTEIRKMFREEMCVLLDDDEYGEGRRARPSMASLKSVDEFSGENSGDNLKYASDDDVKNSSHYSDDDCSDEEGDAVGDLGGGAVGGTAAPTPRRRSTYVLNFTDLSWMSSNSLKHAMDGSVGDLSTNNNSPAVADQTRQVDSSSTARTSASTVPAT